ncbi:MAG TPA: hypothetical protein VIM08_15595 [Arthrobacter sp.]
MAAGSYVSGTWLGIVRSRTAVLLGPDTPPALVQSLWEMLENGPEAHEVLSAVTSSSGVSLAQIPWFGIVDFRDPLRVFLRGDLDLTVQLPGGSVDLNGRGVTTWTERQFTDPEWYRLTVPGGSAVFPGLPLGEGVVLLQSLTVALAGIDVGPAPVGLPERAAAHEHGAPAETVIGVPDDDSDYPTRMPEAWQDEEPSPQLDQLPAHELTGTYDHLWERTVVRSIEDAAVREDPDGPDGDAPVPPPAAVDAAGGPAAEQLPAAEPAAEQLPAVEPAAEQLPAAELIDSVPWRTERSSTQASPSPSFVLPAPGPTSSHTGRPPAGSPASAESASAEQASLQPPSPEPSSPEPSSPEPPSAGPANAGQAGFEGDHDGHTVMKTGLAVTAAPPAQAAVPAGDAAAGPRVLARVCGLGHANPPTHAQCAACGLPLPSDAVQVPRPRLGRMRVSTGELVDLDQSLVIGRQPSVSRVQGGVMPRLVQVASPGGDISRSHVEVRLEGWHVMLCDLKATNGTVLVRPGQPPRRLAQNEMAILLDGDIAELGDGISLRFEEIL